MTITDGGKAKAPISSHPAFPAIVALWFAALLGLGSLVLPVVLLDGMVESSGVGALVAAAQPPLGVTARILIALAAGALGIIAGLAVARKVVASQSAPQSDRTRRIGVSEATSAASAKRPISAHDELGTSQLDALGEPDEATRRPLPMPGRRRPLSLASEEGPSEFFESAPLPGEVSSGPPEPPVDELDLAEFAEPALEPVVSRPFGSGSLSGPPVPSAFPANYDFSRPDPSAARAPVDETPAAVERHADDPLPTHAPDAEEPQMPEIAVASPLAFDEPAVGQPIAANPIAQAASARAPDAEVRRDLAGRPLGELGMADLVERFALSLQRRAKTEDPTLELPRLRGLPAEAPCATADIVAEEPAAADEINFAAVVPAPSEAVAARSEPEIPAALRPINFDDHDDGDEAEAAPMADFSLSLDPQVRPFARPAAAASDAAIVGDAAESAEPAQSDAADEADAGTGVEDDDAGYSSLLAMKRPLGAGREFVRIEDGEEDEEHEPLVVFPGQHRPAAPASDGPSREPLSQPVGADFRPFDGPAEGQRTLHVNFASAATPTLPPATKIDAGETERALRAALEKLQKMSGAA